MPLEKQNFNIKINDTEFENYYEKQEQEDETIAKNPNYERQFATIYKKYLADEFANSSNPDFIYRLDFFKKRIVITNEDNLAKFILNLLNVFSLWLNINLFETFLFKTKLFYRP